MTKRSFRRLEGHIENVHQYARYFSWPFRPQAVRRKQRKHDGLELLETLREVPNSAAYQS